MDIKNVANLAHPEAAVLETKSIAIAGMSRQDALKKIEHALQGKPGIKEVRIDPVTGIVSVDF